MLARVVSVKTVSSFAPTVFGHATYARNVYARDVQRVVNAAINYYAVHAGVHVTIALKKFVSGAQQVLGFAKIP